MIGDRGSCAVVGVASWRDRDEPSHLRLKTFSLLGDSWPGPRSGPEMLLTYEQFPSNPLKLDQGKVPSSIGNITPTNHEGDLEKEYSEVPVIRVT